jgi:hypothetical protein
MNKSFQLSALCFAILALSACTAAKLEARLEANPQCKDVVNPKTGAVMPCPGTDRSFYVAAGLEEPRKPKTTSVAPNTSASPQAATNAAPEKIVAPAPNSAPPASSTAPVDCKPQIHKKTGGMLPCPPAD